MTGAEEIARRLASTIGLLDDTYPVEEIRWAARRLFETLARERPLVLLLEDVHWAEQTFLDLVRHVLEAGDAPILVLCLARPELVEEHPDWDVGDERSSILALEPLTADEAAELVSRLDSAGTLSRKQRERVLEVAGGNPLFVEQLVALAAETGPQAQPRDVPVTLQALLAARLDRLGPGERAVYPMPRPEPRRGQARAGFEAPTSDDGASSWYPAARRHRGRPQRLGASPRARRSRYLRCMRAKRFVETVKQLKFAEVLDDGDLRRVLDLYAEANEHSADHVLVGFRVRGSVVRILWAVIEVIPFDPATAKDLAPDLPPSEDGYFCLRFDGLTFSQGPTAELAELNDAKPSGLEDAPAVLLSYPGRVSWEKLRRTAERLL